LKDVHEDNHRGNVDMVIDSDKKGSETITAALPCPFNDTPEYETDNEIIRVKKDIRSLKENAKL
jgi:hypothetical protein